MRCGMSAPDPQPLPDLRVDLITLEAAFELRRAVLRPWLTLQEARAPYAGVDEHFHVGAKAEGQVVGTAGFVTETQPDYDGTVFRTRQWRLRGMATEPAFQGCGLGSRVLDFGIGELARRLTLRGEARAVLWCNGRTPAQSFYERHGFRAIGEVFETPGTGPHYVFWRTVVAA